jgi:hypothetical protein
VSVRRGTDKRPVASTKSTFSSASRPSILLEEPRGAGHMHGARLSPPSVDFKPPRGMDGQAMFTVHFVYLSLVDCFDFVEGLILPHLTTRSDVPL